MDLVGAIGLEPTTPTMSRWCSNQLSYEPERSEIIWSVSDFGKYLSSEKSKIFADPFNTCLLRAT